MQFVITTVVLMVVLLLPVMVAARVVGAENRGFFACTVLVIGLVVVGAIMGRYMDTSPVVAGVAGFVASIVLTRFVLGTGVGGAVLVSVLTVVIQIGALLGVVAITG